MGVHDLDKYPEVKRLLGIPEDEPIFILRAQDKFSTETVAAYADIVFDEVSTDFNDGMDENEKQFREWQSANKDKVKIPD